MRLRKLLNKTILAAIVIGIGWHSSVFATETIKLTAIDGYPEKSAWVKEFINF